MLKACQHMRAFTRAVTAALEAAVTATDGAVDELQPIKDLREFVYRPTVDNLNTASTWAWIRQGVESHPPTPASVTSSSTDVE